jgi:hypothetical protein
LIQSFTSYFNLVKQQGIRFNSSHPLFLVVTGSNPLAVIVCKPDTTKKRLYQLALWWGYAAMVADSHFKAVAMVQTKHFTASGNPDGHAQGGSLDWSPLPTFLIRNS